jgi:hypothetical protein
MNNLKRFALAAVLLPLALACEHVANDPVLLETASCAALPSFAADCTQPTVQAKVRSVLLDGLVEAEIRCTGTALGAPGKVAVVSLYKAQRFQDGSCLARADLFFSAPPTPGFTQSSGSELTRRASPDSDRCLVSSFHVPGVGSRTWVEGGQIHVEGVSCTTSPGTTCTMPVATRCTGDLSAF